MEAKRTAIIATLLVLALVGAGVGYAYTSITSTSDNQIVNEDIIVIPLAGSSEIYNNSTGQIQYNTSRIHTANGNPDAYTPAYGIIPNADGYALTSINHLKLVNEGSEGKTISKITVTISNNTGMCTQLNSTNGDYKDHAISMKVGNTTISSTSASGCTIGSNTIMFEFTGLDIALTANTNQTVDFSFTISGGSDAFDTTTNQYPHSEKFGDTSTAGETDFKYNMQFKAETA